MEQLASDKITGGKIAYLMWIIIVLLLLAFYSTNVSGTFQQAIFYEIFGVIGLVSCILSFIIKPLKEIDFPNTIIYENKTIFGPISRKWLIIMLLFCILVGWFIFFYVGQTRALIGSPTLQLIPFTTPVKGILSFVCANIEDLVFFGTIPAFIFVIFHYLTKNKLVSALMMLILSAPVFALYHFGVYGTQLITSTLYVLLLGYLWIVWVVITRNLWLPLFFHGFNNVGVEIWKSISIANFGWFMWVGIAVLVGLMIYVATRRSKP